MSLYTMQFLKLNELNALHPYKVVSVVWLQFSSFPVFSFPALFRMFCMVSVCCCCLHLGPLHVFLTPGRRNHFAYYNYHAYEGNAIFNTVLSLVTKNIVRCETFVSFGHMKGCLDSYYFFFFFPKGPFLWSSYLACQLQFNCSWWIDI